MRVLREIRYKLISLLFKIRLANRIDSTNLELFEMLGILVA